MRFCGVRTMESPCMVHSNLVPDTRWSLARATRGKTTWPLLESVAITTYCLTFSGNVNFLNRSEAESVCPPPRGRERKVSVPSPAARELAARTPTTPATADSTFCDGRELPVPGGPGGGSGGLSLLPGPPHRGLRGPGPPELLAHRVTTDQFPRFRFYGV